MRARRAVSAATLCSGGLAEPETVGESATRSPLSPCKGLLGQHLCTPPPPAEAAPGAGPEALALLLLPARGRAGMHRGDRHRVRDYRGCVGSDVKGQGPKSPWLGLNRGSCRHELWSCWGSSRHTQGVNGWERAASLHHSFQSISITRHS